MDIGIDIIELKRIKKLPPNTYLRVLNNEEIKVYNTLNPKRKIEYLAGRLALKEAYIKAFNKLDLVFADIAFLNNEDGKIYVIYQNIIQDNVKASLSHSENNCVAIVLKLL